MKKVLLVTAILVVLPLALFAADRIVVLEIFTGTWCPPCAGAAMGAEDLVNEHPGEVLAVEYHCGSSDVFENTNSTIRKSFYGSGSGHVVRGYPTAIFDGIDTIIGGFPTQSMFPYYNSAFNIRASVEPPLEITLEKSGESEGALTATITNTSDDEITGKVHFTITESNIHYKWQIHTILHFVERDMLPDGNGAEITLAAGADTTITRDYEIDPEWIYYTDDLENIEFGCFVQDTTSLGELREILQAAIVPLTNELLEGVEEEATPLGFSLNATTLVKGGGSVELSLDAPADVDVSLYDCLGRKVKTLHQGVLEAGNHRVSFETDALPAGTYFIKATAGAYKQVNKLVVLD
jgi:thiol-disulfide isomerase/thioredoxin